MFDRNRLRFARRLGIGLVLLVVLALVGLFATTRDANAATFYVRPDGGSVAQCTGTVDAPYPGRGSALPCAWQSPLYALPPGGPARIRGGDELRVAAGTYRVGYGAPGATSGAAGVCAAAYPWDCSPVAVPSGSAIAPTRIVGDCAKPTRLVGVERVRAVLELSGSRNVDVSCLEITDGAACAELLGAGALRCSRDAAPFGPWASNGIRAIGGGAVTLRDLNVHGLANRGIVAGGVADWNLVRVRIVGNAWGGWEGDVGASSSNAGTMRFEDVEIAWNGCVESLDGATRLACYGQEQGGYGDGLGTARTGGAWVFEKARVHHNTSDGIDLLYADGSSSITVRGSHFEANAGNQLKTNGPAAIASSAIVGSCAYFRDNAPRLVAGEHCRAAGNALSLGFTAGAVVSVDSSTITGQGDCLVLASGGPGRLVLTGNTFAGDPLGDVTQPGTKVCGFYADAPAGAIALEALRNTWADVKPETAIANATEPDAGDVPPPADVRIPAQPGKVLSCRWVDA